MANDGGKMETVIDFIFLGSKITADGDHSHEIKRHLFLRRKVMTNLNSILKSRDITLPTKAHLNCSTPGFPVHHHFLELTQTHVHWVSDVIQPFHTLSSPSPPAFHLSQHQSFPMSWLFASGGQSTGFSASASLIPINIQDWFPLGLTGWISLQSKGLSRVFSNTTVQKHQFFGAQLSL